MLPSCLRFARQTILAVLLPFLRPNMAKWLHCIIITLYHEAHSLRSISIRRRKHAADLHLLPTVTAVARRTYVKGEEVDRAIDLDAEARRQHVLHR